METRGRPDREELLPMYAFFPAPWFGWFFLTVLFAFLAVAAWKDYQTMMVPKWLTVPALGLGILFNVSRAVWLGYAGYSAWMLGDNGPVVGGLDGLLFSLAGFAVAFVLFFLLWILGACGGGDVKLFAALGAWIGPMLAVIVLMATIVVVFCFLLGRLVSQLVTGRYSEFRQSVTAGKQAGLHSRKRALSFALPLMISVALVLPWTLRFDLRMVKPTLSDVNEKEHVHAR